MPLFRSVELFDRILEPSNIDIIDAMFARLNHSIYAASGKYTREGLRKLKAENFKLIREETIFKTPEELEKEKEKAQKKKQEQILSDLSPKEREELFKRKRAKNGKR